MLKKLLNALWENKWTPWSLLNYEASSKFIEYSTPIVSLFGTDRGYWSVVNARTKLGEFVDTLSGPAGLIYTGLHYIIFIVLWTLIVPAMALIKSVHTLFTKKWKNVRDW